MNPLLKPTLIRMVTGYRVPDYLHDYFVECVFEHLMEMNPDRTTLPGIKKAIRMAIKDCQRKGRH